MIKKLLPGLLLCVVISIPCWFLGLAAPLIGAPVLGIVAGAIGTQILKKRDRLDLGISFVVKKVLQVAVVLLGFGLNLEVVVKTGVQSLPIIISIISVSLLIAFLMHKTLHIPAKISALVGVGSSICGGSAIAATTPVIEANDEEVAQAMSVIFFFNLLAALLFPALGAALGFSTHSGTPFGIFSGTAVNDTSSVTATAATWDALYGLGSQTLDKAVTVKLTRTLTIIPITLVLGLVRARKEKDKEGSNFSFKRAFPTFIVFFILASLITTEACALGVPQTAFLPVKELSKFLIVMAMVAIGLNTDVVKLVKTGAKPLLLGFTCWSGIILVSLAVQKMVGIW